MKIDLVEVDRDTIRIKGNKGRRVYIDLFDDHMRLSVSSGKLLAYQASDSVIMISHDTPNIKSKKDKVK